MAWLACDVSRMPLTRAGAKLLYHNLIDLANTGEILLTNAVQLITKQPYQ